MTTTNPGMEELSSLRFSGMMQPWNLARCVRNMISESTDTDTYTFPNQREDDNNPIKINIGSEAACLCLYRDWVIMLRFG